MSELLNRGLELAIFGMGTVFVFLTLLVMATVVMSRAILAWDLASAVEEPEQIGSDQHSLDRDRRLVAVITAAVRRYRADHE